MVRLLRLHMSRGVNMKLFDKILCAVDFDESSTVVLHFARELAQQNGATLCVLHVAPLPLNATEFSPRLGPMRAAHRHRRQLTSRLRPHHLDFLSVGEEFGADALGRTPYMVEICGRGERYEENSAEVRP